MGGRTLAARLSLRVQFQQLQRAGIALVEVERDSRGIAIDAEGELREIVRTDRQAVEELAGLRALAPPGIGWWLTAELGC